MQAFPRVVVALAILAAAFSFAPPAAADDCLQLNTARFDLQEGLRLIANTGRQLTFGVRSGEPGEGIAFVVIITPSVCSGFGLTPAGTDLEQSDIDALFEDLPANPPLLPLP